MDLPEIPWVERADLPARRTAVLVVDMQNDFVHERGALPVPAAAATVEPIARFLGRARDAGAGLIYTQDWHAPDDPEFRIWPPHAVGGTWGAEVVEALAPQPGEIRIRKTTYDPFHRTELEEAVASRGWEHLVIVGTVANICVLHAAGSAALRGLGVVVPGDGISALTPSDLHFALRQITFLYRGTAVRSEAGIRFT